MLSTGLKLAAILICVFCAPSWAGTISEHLGANDPTTEGFFWPGNISNGGLAPDGATGFNAWTVIGGGGSSFYQDPFTLAEAADVVTNGWILSVRMRTPTAGSFTYSSLWDGSRRWDLLFSSSAGGDRVELYNGSVGSGPSFTVPGSPNQYHLYEYLFTPSANSADLFVDGVERISNYAGLSQSVTPSVIIGSTNNVQGNFNLVRLETPPFQTTAAPEPATYGLMGAALLFLPVLIRVSRSARFE
jgi:hypothetical protein